MAFQIVAFQITVDSNDPDLLARFWAATLGYELQGPPSGFSSWSEYWLSVGVPPDEVDDGYDAIVDPSGAGPRIWFQRVPEDKSVKNRMHFDLLVGGGRAVALDERRRRVDAEVSRLLELGAAVRHVMDAPDQDHYAVAMADPEANEFDVV